jgi:hypothetical protein
MKMVEAGGTEIDHLIVGPMDSIAQIICPNVECSNRHDVASKNTATVRPCRIADLETMPPDGSESFSVAFDGDMVVGAIRCNMCGTEFRHSAGPIPAGPLPPGAEWDPFKLS